MKQKFSFLAGLLVLSLFLSNTLQAQKEFKSAIDLNDHMAAITDSLYIQGTTIGRLLEKSIAAKDYSKIAPARKDIQAYANKQIAELKKMKAQYGSAELQKVMISFLEYEVKLMDEGFGALEKLSATSTEAEIKTAVQKLIDYAADEEIYLGKVREIQKKFAEANGFTIEDEEQ